MHRVAWLLPYSPQDLQARSPRPPTSSPPPPGEFPTLVLRFSPPRLLSLPHGPWRPPPPRPSAPPILPRLLSGQPPASPSFLPFSVRPALRTGRVRARRGGQCTTCMGAKCSKSSKKRRSPASLPQLLPPWHVLPLFGLQSLARVPPPDRAGSGDSAGRPGVSPEAGVDNAKGVWRHCS